MLIGGGYLGHLGEGDDSGHHTEELLRKLFDEY